MSAAACKRVNYRSLLEDKLVAQLRELYMLRPPCLDYEVWSGSASHNLFFKLISTCSELIAIADIVDQ